MVSCSFYGRASLFAKGNRFALVWIGQGTMTPHSTWHQVDFGGDILAAVPVDDTIHLLMEDESVVEVSWPRNDYTAGLTVKPLAAQVFTS